MIQSGHRRFSLDGRVRRKAGLDATLKPPRVLIEIKAISSVRGVHRNLRSACRSGRSHNPHGEKSIFGDWAVAREHVESQKHHSAGSDHMGIRRLLCRLADVRSHRNSDQKPIGP